MINNGALTTKIMIRIRMLLSILFLTEDADISASEKAVLEKRIGYVVRKIISKIDVDGDGKVSVKEAVSAMRGSWTDHYG